MAVYIYVILLITSLQEAHTLPAPKVPASEKVTFAPLPPPDGNLNVYSLPVGQGDARVIQCPSGDLNLFDMGSNDYDRYKSDLNTRFMLPSDIRTFFGSQQERIANIFISHNHYDHYSLLTDTFNQNDLQGLQHIYMSCNEQDMAYQIKEWVELTNLSDKVRLFNNGHSCGPTGVLCDPVNLCPFDSDVTSWVLAANLGQHCSDGGNKNMDSIVLKMERAGTSVLFTGDFEDETTDWNEIGNQKFMVDFYGSKLKSTVYSIAHHGATHLANKPVWLDAIAPRAVMVSSNPYYSYHHPRCAAIDRVLSTLCEPSAEEGIEGFCGSYPLSNVPLYKRLQSTYTCGNSDDVIEVRNNNQFAVYTTTPDSTTTNLIRLAINAKGDWGFETNIVHSRSLRYYWFL